MHLHCLSNLESISNLSWKMPILCSVVFSQTQGKTAKKVRADFFTADIDSGYQSCVFLMKNSPHIQRGKKKKKEMQEYKFNTQMDLYLL